MEYYDKNGKEIKAGMVIKHDSGDVEKVYPNWDGDDLGVNATNEQFFENHPNVDMRRQIYPLSQFDLSEWEIVEK